MNIKEEFGKEMLDIIRTTKEGVVKGIDIIETQIPDVAHQILRFELIHNLFMMIVCAIILGASYFLIRKACRSPQREELRNPGLWGFTLIGSVLAGTLSFFSLVSHSISGLKLWLAPKLFLIEYLSNFVK